MMSTIGRIPVIAAPTHMPVMPCSEIGESMTRLGPNSSTSPESTLKGVPASATSSPRIKMCGSRRISSARASRIACPRVITRVPWSLLCLAAVLGIDILIYLTWIWEWCIEPKFNTCLNLGTHPLLDLLKRSDICHLLLGQPLCEDEKRISLALPLFLLFFGAIV